MQILLFSLGGILIGMCLSMAIHIKHSTYGFIHIDHDTEQLTVELTSDDLKDKHTKYAVLKVDHEAKISRDEHVL